MEQNRVPSSRHPCGHFRHVTNTKDGVRTVFLALIVPADYEDDESKILRIAQNTSMKFLTDDMGCGAQLRNNEIKLRFMHSVLLSEDVTVQHKGLGSLLRICIKGTDYTAVNVPVGEEHKVYLESAGNRRLMFGIVLLKFPEIFFHLQPCKLEESN